MPHKLQAEVLLFIEPEELADRLDDPSLLILDLGKTLLYEQIHVPGASYLPYESLVTVSGRTAGLLPAIAQLNITFSDYGIDNNRTVIAYDDEGGGKAARLIWTLHCLGHTNAKLLNGGIHAWANEGFPRDKGPVSDPQEQSRFSAKLSDEPVADASYIYNHLDDPNVILLDARSREEFTGDRKFAQQGGHIPGAVHFEWSDAMDKSRNLRLTDKQALSDRLESLHVDKEKTVVCYCQTHHRSSFLYVVLKHLEYPRVKGYPGSWSDWGNRNEFPIET